MPDPISTLEDKYILGAKVAGIGLGTVDYIGDTITLDDRAAALFDLPANVPVSRDVLHDRIHPDDRAGIDHQVCDLLDPHGESFIEVTHRVVRADGDICWVNARKEVTFGPAAHGTQSQPVSGLVAIIDVTDHKQNQEQIQFLLDELNHRTKNLLTVVQSIARRTAASGDMDDFNDRFSSRLTGLAHNQDALVRNNWLYADLKELITAHLRAFGDIDSGRISIDGPDHTLGAHGAQAIGMAMHELATNASKYGALSVPEGRVDVTWTHIGNPNDGFVITWQERGGPAVREPERAGFGQMVLRDMAAASLSGTVDLQYRETGVFWQLTVPANTGD